MQSIESILLASNQAWDKAFNENQVSALVAMYEDVAAVIPAGGAPAVGSQAIEAFWNGMKSQGVVNHQLSMVALVVVESIAIQHGQWRAAAVNDGQRNEFSGNVQVIFRRQPEGGWKIISHMWN